MVGFLDGCLRDIQFHHERLHYLDPILKQPGVQITNVNVQAGCKGRDVCAAGPCSINSFCTDLFNDYECQCLPGWEGGIFFTNNY